jgi:hypothetical protein
MPDGKSPVDYPTLVGAVLGRAARTVVDWWRGLDQRVASGRPDRRALPSGTTTNGTSSP